jgi:hypothetical protein
VSENPLTAIREGVQTALRTVSGIKWAEIYDGESWNDNQFEDIRRRVALHGSGVYARIMRTALVEDSPLLADSNQLWLQCLVAAGVVANRAKAAENAEQLAWAVYEELRGTETGDECLLLPWRLAGFAVEHQSPNCTIISVVMRNQVDFGTWEDEE